MNAAIVTGYLHGILLKLVIVIINVVNIDIGTKSYVLTSYLPA